MFEDEDIDQDDLDRLVQMEKSVHGEKSNTELAEQILEQAAPAAAASIVKIATSDPNSQVRFRAAVYIVDRTLGKTGDGPTKRASWDDLFDDVAVEVK